MLTTLTDLSLSGTCPGGAVYVCTYVQPLSVWGLPYRCGNNQTLGGAVIHEATLGFVNFPDTLPGRTQPSRVGLWRTPLDSAADTGGHREERTTLYQKALRGAVVGWRGTALPSRGGCHVRLSSWGAFSTRLGGVEFLFFARHVFVLSL